MEQITSDGAVKSEKEIISDYMRNLAKKSHSAVKEKYGADYYRQIRLKGWSKKKSEELRKEIAEQKKAVFPESTEDDQYFIV